MIYLDAAATTPIVPAVLDAMMPYLTQQYANPGALYNAGREAAKAVEKARTQVSGFLGGDQGSILFTSGGSEANSLAFHGVKDYLRRTGRTHILVSAVEHDSVLKAAESLTKLGFDIEYLPVSSSCTVSQASLERAIRPETGLVSVMYVNNETGAVNDVSGIGAVCRSHGVLFHTDCVQAAGFYPIDAAEIGCDLLSVSAHKIHGPKGVGALYVRDRSLLSPAIHGGSAQEFGLRGGTENVPGIVGFGSACEIAGHCQSADRGILTKLKRVFVYDLDRRLDGQVYVNGPSLDSPGKTVNLRIEGVDNESLILMLDSVGICVSAGSACQSHESKPSHVLTAMGLTAEEARSSIRVSFSRMNTEAEVVEAAKVIASFVQELRAHSATG